MSTRLKALYIIGATLAIVGSFLPWQQEGDFISYWTYGVRIWPQFKDNGGLMIVLLSVVIMSLTFYTPHFVRNLAIWNIVCGIILVLASCYYIGKWLFQRIEAKGIIGAPVLQIGLVMVLLGSLILLSTALFHHLKKT